METLAVLAGAVLTASVLGSMHCVGMCGPLAIWASGAGDHARPRSMSINVSLYHFGRLATYALAGLIAGWLGSIVDVGGSVLGIQVAAARLVGSIMVAMGVYKLWTLWGRRGAAATTTPSAIGGLLVKLRPHVFRLPIPGRAFVTGLLTTLLPCGWLYLFALIAAGTGNPFHGMIVMAAFWLGSVPALVALVAGMRLLSQRFARFVPMLAAALLILAGMFTATGRGFAGFDSLDELRSDGSSLEQIEQVGDKTLPCCQVKH